MKLDWNKFHVFADVAKRNELSVENPQEEIANAILRQGQGIAGYVLAEKVYGDKGEADYDEKEAKVINSLTETLPSMWAVALKETIV